MPKRKRKSTVLSKGQRWSKERNWAKFRLKGALDHLKVYTRVDQVCTLKERQLLREAELAVSKVINNWKRNNSTSKAIYKGR